LPGISPPSGRGAPFPELDNLVAKTPEGVLDMLRIKGIGPKKVRTLWRELAVETTDALLQACEENRVSQLKGFGEKTQENIKQALLFSRQAAGKLHYAEAESVAGGLLQRLRDAGIQAGPAGQLARKSDIVDTLQLLAAAPSPAAVHELLDGLPGLRRDDRTTAPFSWRGALEGSELPLEVLIARPEKFVNQSFILSAAPGTCGTRTKRAIPSCKLRCTASSKPRRPFTPRPACPTSFPNCAKACLNLTWPRPASWATSCATKT
jgi:DNA polymerase (family 10)